MNEQVLHQLQCRREGTLFYYQHGPNLPGNIVTYCPVCGSAEVAPTGRKYAPVDENRSVDSFGTI